MHLKYISGPFMLEYIECNHRNDDTHYSVAVAILLEKKMILAVAMAASTPRKGDVVTIEYVWR
jgi:hypothetical protein